MGHKNVPNIVSLSHCLEQSFSCILTVSYVKAKKRRMRQCFREGHALYWKMYFFVYFLSACVSGFYRTQYPASYTHRSLGRTRQFTLPASAGTQMCLLCLSLKSQIPKLFRNDSGFPIFTGYL